VPLGSYERSPEPQNGSYSASPALRWLRIGVSNKTRASESGVEAWLSGADMIILGEGTRQIVAWSLVPRKRTLAPFRRTTQQGSWLQ